MEDPKQDNDMIAAYSSIAQHLQNMINYNHFQSDALSLFKTEIAHLSEQLFPALSSLELVEEKWHKTPIEKWDELLVAQQRILGWPEYKRADPHLGVNWYLSPNTAENKMLDYINNEINAIHTIVKRRALLQVRSVPVQSVQNTQSCVSNQYFVQTTRRRHT